MATSTSYRLPGVYSNETTGPFVNAAGGGAATVAFIGPALGYSEASAQATISGFEPVTFDNVGVISGGITVKSRSTGRTFTSGVDYTESTDLEGVTSIVRRLTSLSLSKSTVTNRSKTYYTAEPEFSIMVDAGGMDLDGYPISGTVVVLDHTADDMQLVEGVDYVIDYHEGTFGIVSGGELANANANAHELYISFEWCTAEPLELVGESAWVLDHEYISEAGLASGASIRIVSCGYEDAGTEYEWESTPNSDEGYIENIDFVVDYQSGRITRTASSRIPSFDVGKKNYMYAEFAYCGIRDGEALAIDYLYQGEDYGFPTPVSSYVEAAKIYGNAFDPKTGDVISPLSLAAYIAFQNGMSNCYMVAVQGNISEVTSYDDVTDTTSSEFVTRYTSKNWEDAFEALTVIDGIDIVCPLTDDISYLNIGRAHLAAMKSNQDERVMICGLDGTSSTVSIAGQISRANNFGDSDIWMVGPSTVRFRNPIRNTVDVIPGYYMAAAVAGYEASVPQYTPLTRKALTGFYSANEYATKLGKTNACANGVMYIDEVNGQLRILHGTSTNVESIIPRETNITLTKYFIIKRLRRMFENGYIGEIINDETVAGVQMAMIGALVSFVEGNYMYSYDALNIAIDEQIPTQINISFRYIPMYSLNYIQISFAINTTGSRGYGVETY